MLYVFLSLLNTLLQHNPTLFGFERNHIEPRLADTMHKSHLVISHFDLWLQLRNVLDGLFDVQGIVVIELL